VFSLGEVLIIDLMIWLVTFVTAQIVLNYLLTFLLIVNHLDEKCAVSSFAFQV